MILNKDMDFDAGIKIELGSGQNPQPGFLHVEISDNFPDVDIVCDLSKEKLPIPDGCVIEMIHNHLIEHIPWRDLPFIVGEMSRVMKSGGKMFFRTPDLEAVVKAYIKGEDFSEWPPDMKAMEDVFGEWNPSTWLMIKLFSGQDYPSNFHYSVMDFKLVKMLLERHGFTNVSRVDVHPKFSPLEMQVECFKV